LPELLALPGGIQRSVAFLRWQELPPKLPADPEHRCGRAQPITELHPTYCMVQETESLGMLSALILGSIFTQ
jgi:hypothetical protein